MDYERATARWHAKVLAAQRAFTKRRDKIVQDYNRAVSPHLLAYKAAIRAHDEKCKVDLDAARADYEAACEKAIAHYNSLCGMLSKEDDGRIKHPTTLS